ncbi:hypothetical protein [Streptomyces sp. GC420]|nr:hypothetical protein [Streptomyces sp. GC420]
MLSTAVASTDHKVAVPIVAVGRALTATTHAGGSAFGGACQGAGCDQD